MINANAEIVRGACMTSMRAFALRSRILLRYDDMLSIETRRNICTGALTLALAHHSAYADEVECVSYGSGRVMLHLFVVVIVLEGAFVKHIVLYFIHHRLTT